MSFARTMAEFFAWRLPRKCYELSCTASPTTRIAWKVRYRGSPHSKSTYRTQEVFLCDAHASAWMEFARE